MIARLFRFIPSFGFQHIKHPFNRVYDHTKRCQVGSDTHLSVIAIISNKRNVVHAVPKEKRKKKNEKDKRVYSTYSTISFSN